MSTSLLPKSSSPANPALTPGNIKQNPAPNPPALQPQTQVSNQNQNRPYPLSKESAGNAYWKVLHSYAYSYPEHANQEDANNFKIVFLQVMRSFPCDTCREDAKQYFIAHPPPLASRKELVRWFCDFHNHVNVKLGKKEEDCNVMEPAGEDKPCPSCSVLPKQESSDNKAKSEAANTQSNVIAQTNSNQPVMKDLATTFKDYKTISSKIIQELCAREQLPMPDIIYQPCPEAPETSCTSIYRNPTTKDHIRKPLIYLNPNVFALRTVVHEFYHYAMTMKGQEDLAMDEFAVEKMAQEVIAREFPYDKTPSAVAHMQPKKIEIMNDPASPGQPVQLPPRRLSVMQRFQLLKEARRRKYKVKKQSEPEPPMTIAESPTAVDPSTNIQNSSMTPEAVAVSTEGKFPTYQMIRQRYENERFAEAKDGDDRDGFFSGFDSLYGPIAPHLGLPPRALNEAFTADFIANSVTTIAKSNLSPIGSLIFTSFGGTGLLFSNFFLKSQTGVALGDRKMMTNIASNLMLNALNYANPKVSKRIMKDAKKIGGHIASFEFDKILPLLIESPFLRKSRAAEWRKGSGGTGGGSAPPPGSDPSGGGVGGGLSAPRDVLGGQLAATNMENIAGAGVVSTGGGSVYSPTIVPQGPFAQQGPPREAFQQGLGSIQTPDLESMSFNERLRYIEQARAAGAPGRERGGYYRGSPTGSERHGRDFGVVPPRSGRIMEDEEAFGPLGSNDEMGLPPELAPYEPGYLSDEEEELFGGQARADMYGVRRNSINSYYDDLSDLR